MGIGLAFWILMLIWLVGGLYYGYASTPDRFFLGGNIMLFILFVLVGWQVFGAPLHG